MALFEKELARLEERQRQLGSAEKLLGMPGTVYPNLLKAQQDAKAMKQVYDIYAEQKVSVTLRNTHMCSCTDTQQRWGQKKRLHCPLVTVNSEAFA